VRNCSGSPWGRIAALFLLLITVWPVDAAAGQLSLTWINSSTDELGFSVERSTETTDSFTEIATTEPGVTAYTDSNLADATTYCYRVRAFNAVGYSDYANVACGTTPQMLSVQMSSVTVLKFGPGSGMVVSPLLSDDLGAAPRAEHPERHVAIVCGASCSGIYPVGAAEVLTAIPDSDSTFLGWSGGGCSGTDSCTVTVTAATTVTATFDLRYPVSPP
jgi:hypothetical protein